MSLIIYRFAYPSVLSGTITGGTNCDWTSVMSLDNKETDHKTMASKKATPMCGVDFVTKIFKIFLVLGCIALFGYHFGGVLTEYFLKQKIGKFLLFPSIIAVKQFLKNLKWFFFTHLDLISISWCVLLIS